MENTFTSGIIYDNDKKVASVKICSTNFTSKSILFALQII